MKNDLKDIKLEYHQKELTIDGLAESPYLQFMNWMDEAIENNIPYPNNAVISTCSQEGVVSSRVILLKGISDKGVLFFTNYDSDKGADIAAHPQVALNIFWKENGSPSSSNGPAPARPIVKPLKITLIADL